MCDKCGDHCSHDEDAIRKEERDKIVVIVERKMEEYKWNEDVCWAFAQVLKSINNQP